jgi:uncharacterized delta-60 repeat protein
VESGSLSKTGLNLKIYCVEKNKNKTEMKKQLIIAGILLGSFAIMAQNSADRDNSFNVTGLGTPVFPTGGQYSKVTPVEGGKVLVTGAFYSAATTTPAYSRILRLNSDGSFDNTFNVGGLGATGIISATAVQSDGKIIIGGGFPAYNGTSVNGIARINPDGSLDNTFNPGTGFSSILPPPWVRSIAIQEDGKIVVGGGFTSFNGTAIAGVCRLNADGSLDNSFSPGSGPNNIVEAVAIQTDGKIIAGGLFSSFDGVSNGRLVRLEANGSLDGTFNTATSGNILRVVVQPDGKILSSGANFYRLETNGSLDAGFIPMTAGNSYNGLALQSDGRIILSGFFTSYFSTPRERIVRLNTNGTVDMTFDSEVGFSANPNHLAIQPDGKILVFGGFEYKGVESVVTRIMGTPVPFLGIDNPANQLDVNVFPNPASININVTLDESYMNQGVNLAVLNTAGQVVKQVLLDYSHTTIDLEQMPTGIYFYQIRNNNRVIKSGKIIVN